MKRHLITLILLQIILSSAVFGQKTSIDIGRGEYDQVRIAVNVLYQIETGGELAIKDYFLDEKGYNEKKWQKHVSFIRSEYANDGNSLPTSAVSPGNSIWYERTYYEKAGDEIKYHLQVYFELVEAGDEIKIKKVTFRKGKKVVRRDQEIKRMDSEDFIPPPPAIPDY